MFLHPPWEQRNHGLKYESDCISIGISIKIWILEGFVILLLLSFCHPHRKWTETFFSRTSFCSRCVSCENCLRPRRNFRPKYENCFAILISVCNFHISLRFSCQFAILTFWYSSKVDICNFHVSLQFSYEFAIFISVCNSHIMTPALTYVALYGFYVTMTMTLNSLTPRQPRFSVEDNDKLELSKIDYYLLFKSS